MILSWVKITTFRFLVGWPIMAVRLPPIIAIQMVTWSSDYTLPPNGLCGITPVTFTVMDDCGNVATAEAYFIIEDFDPPLLLSEAEDMTVLCSDNAAAEVILWLQAHGGAQASDPCGPVVGPIISWGA
ncbi:MAG: hypothetical protein R2778_13145 [Saprospiraceae bacterium]